MIVLGILVIVSRAQELSTLSSISSSVAIKTYYFQKTRAIYQERESSVLFIVQRSLESNKTIDALRVKGNEAINEILNDQRFKSASPDNAALLDSMKGAVDGLEAARRQIDASRTVDCKKIKVSQVVFLVLLLQSGDLFQ